MSEPLLPDSIDLYEQSVNHTRKIFAGVKPEHMKATTPCDDWDVKTLMEHITGGFAMVVNAFQAGHFTAADHAVAGLPHCPTATGALRQAQEKIVGPHRRADQQPRHRPAKDDPDQRQPRHGAVQELCQERPQ